MEKFLAVSSGEAECYGCARAASQAVGLRGMLEDLGVTGKRLRIKTDSSVAKSLASRRGLGGIRHIKRNQRWRQENVNNGEVEIEKVMGIIKRALALTKPKDGASIKQHSQWIKHEITGGRHDYATKRAKVGP